MKELTAAFHSEIFRPVVSLVVPGFFATATFSIAVWQRIPGVPQLVDGHPGTAGIIMFLIILTAGLILEDFGARLERSFDENLCKLKDYEHHLEDWYDYLRIAFPKEPIGHRYLRSLVLRLKFELGMTFASILFAAGTTLLEIACVWRICIILIGTTGFFYFRIEAKSSNKELSKVRHELLKTYRGVKGNES